MSVSVIGSNTSIEVTGVNIQNPNFSGMGGTTVFINGNVVVVSGATPSGGGVLTGNYDIGGTAANTGAILLADINSLSGFTTGISGYLVAHAGAGNSNVQVSGSSIINNANFTGISGISIIWSGGFVFVAGGGLCDPLGTAQSTGQILYNLVTGMSGQDVLNYATIVNLTQTGIIIENQLNSLSGFVTGQSGFSNLNYATINNLFTSGSNLFGDIVGLSGVYNLGIYNTGSLLYNLINGLSGVVNTTVSNLQNTGQNLYNLITAFSGTFQDFAVIALTGFSGSQTVSFPSAYPVAPNVVNCQMIIWSGNNYSYFVSVQNITNTNFLCNFSDALLETGNILSIQSHL